ncbi:nucleotide kinase domain-containing protein [Enterococcus rotai]|uniref:nucleotide kinase domain-containing protein n=1 Tax=Enterococcus rotai TaxID=118060 RepID=UPI0032B5CA68
MNENDGKIYIFEGIDNVGKSTVMEDVSKRLKQKDIDVSMYSFPGKDEGTLGSLVYDIHHKQEEYFDGELNPISLQLLHVSAHIELIKKSIIPDLKKGKLILLDRFWWSTFCYGIVSGINKSDLEDLLIIEFKYWEKIKINKIFYIERKLVEPFDIERDKNLLDEYKKITNNSSQNLVLNINNNCSLNETSDKIVSEIMKDFEAFQMNLFDNNILKKNKDFKNINPSSTLIKSPIYSEYWKFTAERQKIFFARFNNEKFPWSQDYILNKYKFTNVYRASDRVSQYLIRNVIYQTEQAHNEKDILFRILLFKLFNKIETWETLEEKLGEVSYKTYSFDVYNKIFLDELEQNKKIYSAAYIMPSGVSSFNHSKKHQNNLKLLEYMLKDNLLNKIKECNSLEELYHLLIDYPTLGSFLAFQLAIDINYSPICDFDEMSFVIAGPGAKRGIDKCFEYRGKYTYEDVIKWMADKQEKEISRLNLEFSNLWGRKLQLIDCQNIFCETDKYTRVKHPEYNLGKNTRIKQMFRASNRENIEYFFPPKWGINESIKRERIDW